MSSPDALFATVISWGLQPGAAPRSSVSFVERSEAGTDTDDDIPPICSVVPGNEGIGGEIGVLGEAKV